jgi:hypothetical protein
VSTEWTVQCADGARRHVLAGADEEYARRVHSDLRHEQTWCGPHSLDCREIGPWVRVSCPVALCILDEHGTTHLDAMGRQWTYDGASS